MNTPNNEQNPLDEIFLTEKETELYNKFKEQFENRTKQQGSWLKRLETSHKKDLKTIWRLRKRLVLMNNCIKKGRTQAISKFKEKLKERVLDNLETHKRYGKSTIESRMRFNDILKDINKTAQEIK